MTTVQEFDLELSFPEAQVVIHFDDSDYHASSTVQRVDFIGQRLRVRPGRDHHRRQVNAKGVIFVRVLSRR